MLNNFNYFIVCEKFCIFVRLNDWNMVEKQKQERGVVHLFLKQTQEHKFYGNLKALFDNEENEENDGTLGVSYNYMKNWDFSNGHFYSNDLVEIRKGVINTSTKKEWMRNNKNRK